mmetsp:Transcript_18550/g.35006  ORF Transcript_18550/g.35006 Transcript_18550/m.35006 type:complete len:139 (-) Transcript_18550:173-589(-)
MPEINNFAEGLKAAARSRGGAPPPTCAIVYLSEAHASDQWPLGNHVCIDQHKNIADRVKAARAFGKAMAVELPILVDSLANTFTRTLAAHPMRWYVVDGTPLRLKFKAEPVDVAPTPTGCSGYYGYDFNGLRTFLKLC